MVQKGSVGSKLKAGTKVRKGGEIARQAKLGGRIQAARRDPELGQRDRRRGLRQARKRAD